MIDYKYTPPPERLLWCESEQTWTKHVLDESMKFYVCACGEQVSVDWRDPNDMWRAE